MTRKPIVHGTITARFNHKCCCTPCREAGNRYTKERRAYHAARLKAGLANVIHGELMTYREYGCRCRLCKTANAVASAEYRAKKREERWSKMVEEQWSAPSRG